MKIFLVAKLIPLTPLEHSNTIPLNPNKAGLFESSFSLRRGDQFGTPFIF